MGLYSSNVLAHFELGTVQYKNPYSELGKILPSALSLIILEWFWNRGKKHLFGCFAIIG